VKREYLAAKPGASDEALSAYLEAAAAEAALEHSLAGRLGKLVEPLFRPLGFDWKIGVATITGFAAKEVVVSTLGILYRVGASKGEEIESLRQALAGDPGFNPLVAFTLMLFILVIPPCFAALATIRAELGWRWLAFAFAFMLIAGWGLGCAVYQIGALAGLA
jgi:ferrous iron transport protein B